MKRIALGFMVVATAWFLADPLFPADSNAQMRGMMAPESCPKGMGMGMMPHGMGPGMSMCGWMLAADEKVKVDIKELSDGVSITLRSDDKNTARKLQIRGQMMKLMQEMVELK